MYESKGQVRGRGKEKDRETWKKKPGMITITNYLYS